MNIVLTGMKHCGKSTLGAALAVRLGCPFHDVDSLIEATHACASGRRISTREIYQELGEEGFHRLEGHVVCELYLKLERPGTSAVVSLGGRTALNPSVSQLLGGIGRIIYLHVSPDELYRRIERAGLPPFLEGPDPRAKFDELYRRREPRYRALADEVVDVNGLKIDEAVDRLLSSLGM